LAGQPQDPWQSPAQDQTRPAWQPFTPSSADKQDSYGYPESGQSAPAYGQSYSQRGGYPEPSYTVQDPVYGGQEQAYGDQAYGEQGRQAPQGQPDQQGQPGQQAAHWQAVSGMTAAHGNAKAKSGDKGFFSALFDFSFTSFVTPKIIKVLYVLITVWTVLWALIFLRYGFKYGGAAGGFFTLLVVDPILIILTLGAYRMVLELFMVVHRMHEDLKAIRDRGDN
jgi:uncharacterized membrane protein